jgi:hypothetical protein
LSSASPERHHLFFFFFTITTTTTIIIIIISSSSALLQTTAARSSEHSLQHPSLWFRDWRRADPGGCVIYDAALQPLGAWLFVTCLLCAVLVQASATGRSLVQGSPTEC